MIFHFLKRRRRKDCFIFFFNFIFVGSTITNNNNIEEIDKHNFRTKTKSIITKINELCILIMSQNQNKITNFEQFFKLHSQEKILIMKIKGEKVQKNICDNIHVRNKILSNFDMKTQKNDLRNITKLKICPGKLFKQYKRDCIEINIEISDCTDVVSIINNLHKQAHSNFTILIFNENFDENLSSMIPYSTDMIKFLNDLPSSEKLLLIEKNIIPIFEIVQMLCLTFDLIFATFNTNPDVLFVYLNNNKLDILNCYQNYLYAIFEGFKETILKLIKILMSTINYKDTFFDDKKRQLNRKIQNNRKKTIPNDNLSKILYIFLTQKRNLNNVESTSFSEILKSFFKMVNRIYNDTQEIMRNKNMVNNPNLDHLKSIIKGDKYMQAKYIYQTLKNFTDEIESLKSLSIILKIMDLLSQNTLILKKLSKEINEYHSKARKNLYKF